MKLDPEETLHLAIHAGSTGQHHACLSYLKELLQAQPDNTRALYLQAAQHATLGLVDRAIGELDRVLSLAPDFGIAQFQLALLLLDRAQPDAAAGHFRSLATGRSPGLAALASAMLAHGEGDDRAARGFLALAAQRPEDNPALADLVRRIVGGEGGEGREGGAARRPTPATGAGQPAAGERVYLGAYGRSVP